MTTYLAQEVKGRRRRIDDDLPRRHHSGAPPLGNRKKPQFPRHRTKVGTQRFLSPILHGNAGTPARADMSPQSPPDIETSQHVQDLLETASLQATKLRLVRRELVWQRQIETPFHLQALQSTGQTHDTLIYPLPYAVAGATPRKRPQSQRQRRTHRRVTKAFASAFAS